MPVIDQEKCDGCGLCVGACTCGALFMVEGRVVVLETENCGWCLQCEAICPCQAIAARFEIVFEEI